MTIVAAIRDGDRQKTYIGSDSMARDNGAWTYFGPKFVQVGIWWVGFSGVARLEVVLAGMAGPEIRTAREMATEIRAALDDDGFKREESSGFPSYQDTQLILASPSQIWAICPGFSCTQVPDGNLAAIGGGDAIARGAAHAAKAKGAAPRDRLCFALQAAIDISIDCAGYPIIETI